jgi:hypothetical protein
VTAKKTKRERPWRKVSRRAIGVQYRDGGRGGPSANLVYLVAETRGRSNKLRDYRERVDFGHMVIADLQTPPDVQLALFAMRDLHACLTGYLADVDAQKPKDKKRKMRTP